MTKLQDKTDEFVKVPIWWIKQATRVTRTPQAMVCVWLLHLAWKANKTTFVLPNAKLATFGVDRRAKYRALINLEKAGLIEVEWCKKRSPKVTLRYLAAR